MDSYPHQAPPEAPRPPSYTGGFAETPYAAGRPPPGTPTQWAPPPAPTLPGHAGPQWTSPPGGYQAYGFGFATPPPGGGGFGGPHFAPPYGFDPSVPPPPFGCPPPGHTVAPAPVGPYGGTATFAAQLGAFQAASDAGHSRHHDYEGVGERGAPLGGGDRDRRPGAAASQPQDEAALQRRQDSQWVGRFLQGRRGTSPDTQRRRTEPGRVPALREALHGAARLLAALEEACDSLGRSVEDDRAWTDSYLSALNVRRELEDRVQQLGDGEALSRLKADVRRLSQRRTRRLRARKALQMEERRRQEDMSEKEAAIDKWRMKKIHEVEEKKREQELKLAADSVLCEVRRKQADVKRMQDILRSLEKLRKLRKEAASRKGIVTEQECDEAFSGRLEQLRSVMKTRTAVYSAEEKALMVMLEGEQQEERRRERERRLKKERERQLQRKRRVDSVLFGDEPPADSILQPFTEYYTQAQRSLQALIQIRREWDVFVVAADHPDGSPVPQNWVLPDPPSHQDWASALQTADGDADGL